jgi:hypothetical protein
MTTLFYHKREFFFYMFVTQAKINEIGLPTPQIIMTRIAHTCFSFVKTHKMS